MVELPGIGDIDVANAVEREATGAGEKERLPPGSVSGALLAPPFPPSTLESSAVETFLDRVVRAVAHIEDSPRNRRRCLVGPQRNVAGATVRIAPTLVNGACRYLKRYYR